MQRFDTVDVLEPLPHFIAEAKRRLSTKPHSGQFYEIGLQVGMPRCCAFADRGWMACAGQCHVTARFRTSVLLHARTMLCGFRCPYMPDYL